MQLWNNNVHTMKYTQISLPVYLIRSLKGIEDFSQCLQHFVLQGNKEAWQIQLWNQPMPEEGVPLTLKLDPLYFYKHPNTLAQVGAAFYLVHHHSHQPHPRLSERKCISCDQTISFNWKWNSEHQEGLPATVEVKSHMLFHETMDPVFPWRQSLPQLTWPDERIYKLTPSSFLRMMRAKEATSQPQ